jgi:hypothetical protein
VECRISIDVAETAKLLRDSTACDVALALFRENPEDLFMLWTSIGETERIAVLVRGDEYCAQMKGQSTAEKFRSIYLTLLERYKAIRVNELTAKMQKSQATSEELLELVRLKNA